MQAERLLLQAREIRKKVLGEGHPDYAASLHNLAFTYTSQGDVARAEPLLLEASKICKAVFGENHPEYAGQLHDLAWLYYAKGDYASAERLGCQAVTIQLHQLESTAVIQSERQQLAMLDTVRMVLSQYLASMPAREQYAILAYRQVLAWKGIVFRRQRLARATEQTPELAELFHKLQQVTGQLAKLAWSKPDLKQAESWRKNVASLSERKDRLEADLSQRSAVFRQAKASATIEDLQAALPKDVPFIDFLEFGHSELVALPQRSGLGVQFDQTNAGSRVTSVTAGGAAAADGRLQPGDLIIEIADRKGAWTQTVGKTAQAIRALLLGEAGSKISLRVRRTEKNDVPEITLTRTPLPGQKKFDIQWKQEIAAFVVRHDGPVVRVNFGPVQPLSEAIDAWRRTCGASAQSAAAGELLRKKIWEPVAAHIRGAKIVLISPDGALSKLPFAALPGKEPGKYLVEEYPLAIVPTAQIIPEIVRGEARRPLAEKVLLVGNVQL